MATVNAECGRVVADGGGVASYARVVTRVIAADRIDIQDAGTRSYFHRFDAGH